MKRICIAAVLLVFAVMLGCPGVSAEAAPLAVTVALDRTSVAVGETVEGHWTAAGGTAPYSNLITTSWIVRSAGSNLTYTAVVASDGAGGFESSFTPATGESLYLRVTVRDAAGISVSAETPVIPVTGAAPVEPLAITVSLDKASVAIGEAVTAQWSVTGGESPYQPLITTMWYAGGATTTARVETLGGGAFSSSFTPASGTSVQLRVSMRDAAGRTESVYSAAIPVYFQYAQGLSLQPASLEVHAQESAALQAVLAPANASDKRVAWSSSDAAVASVDGDGLVRGVSEGEAVITATAMDGSGVSAQAAVRVLPPIPVDSVTLSGGVRVNVGGAARLTAAVLPGNAADKTLVWTTGDARIATVADGVVTGMGYGETTVTATAASGAHATETVTVDPAVRQLRALAYDVGFSIVSGSRCISFTAGAEYGTPPYRLRLKLYFDGTLKTASEYIVSAAEDFLVPVGSAAINARVTVTADVTDAAGHESSASASALVLADGLNIGITQLDEVPPMTLASGVALDRSEATLEMGGQVTLAAAVSPSGATVRRVAWASANPAVAAVDAGGRVTALKPGTAEVTAVTMDGSNLRATCTVEVTPKDVGGLQASLTQSAFTYSGAAHTPAVALADGGTPLAEGADYSLAYRDNRDAGTGVVTVTGIGDYGGSRELAFDILPLQAEFAWAGIEYRLYDGTPALVSASVANLVAGDACEVTVSGGNGVNAGTHTARAAALSNGNYTLPSVGLEQSYTIGKAEYEFSGAAWEYAGAFTYDGAEKRVLVIGLPDGVAASYAGNVATDAGEYTASVSFSYDALNYEAPPALADLAWAIAKGRYDMAAAGWDYDVPLRYDGTEKAVFLTGLPEGVSVASYTGNTATERGEYRASAVLAYDSRNYEPPAPPESLSWAIVRGVYDMGGAGWDYDAPLTYNGALQAVVVTGLPAGVSVADYIGNVRVVPGRYTASVILAYDLDNYERPAIPDLIWEIAKARYDMGGARWDYAGPFVYDGTEKAVSVTGLPEGVTVRGYSPQNQATVVGAYTTFVQFDYDESTHEAPEMAPLHWSIVPARYDMSAARWNYTAPFVYDGKAKSVQVTGLPAGVRVVSYTGNTAAAVGAYTARVTLAGQEGFEQPVLPSLAWKIAAPAAPPAVKAVRVEATGGSSLQVTWTSAAGASGYELWWNTASSGTYTLAKATTALTFTKTYLQPGIRYFFKVRPYMLAGTVKVFGPYSAAAAGVPLAKAVISVAAAVGKDQIRLAWGAVPKAGGYQVYVSGTAGGTYVPLKATTATTLLVTGLKPGTAYYFKVAAYGKFYSVTYFGPASAFRGVKTLAR